VAPPSNRSNTHPRLRICIGASAGGHLSQLLNYITGECNRHHPIRAVRILFKAFRIVRTEKPDVVLTTGSMPLALLCLVAKLFGARIIWIDSVTNVRRLSVSGRWVRLFADLCLTQWPHVQKKYRNVEYAGAIV